MSVSELKIGLYGPWLLELGVGLREIGVDGVKVIIDENEALLTTALRDEPELKDPNLTLIDRWNSRGACLYPKASSLTKLLKEFDVLVLSFLGPMFGPSSKRPYFFWVSGYDLTGVPFPIQSRFHRKRGVLKDFAAFFLAYWQRKGIREANEIWVPPFELFYDAVDSIGKVNSEIVFFPLAHNENLFKPVESGEKDVSESETLKIFHPSNASEAKKILHYCINKAKYTCAIRLNLGPPISENFNIIDKKFSAGEGKVLANGKKIALITYGQTMTSVAYKVNKLLI